MEEEGAAACLLLVDPKSWRTRGKEKFFFFVFFFVDLDFMSGFLPKLKLDLWWGEGEGAFDVKKIQKKIKKTTPTRRRYGRPPRRRYSDLLLLLVAGELTLGERRELLSLLLLYLSFRERFLWGCDVFLVKFLFILLCFCSFLYMRVYCNSVLPRVVNHQIWIVPRSDGDCVCFLLIQYVFLPMLSCVFDV